MDSRYKHPSLPEAEKTLSFILDIVSEGIWDWNAETGEVKRSPGWYRMLGYDVHSLEENVMTWEDAIHPEDYPAVMAHFENYIQGKTDQYQIQYRCKKADGSYLWIEDSGKIVERDDSGQVKRMIGAHTDIHKAKTAQQELEQKNLILASDNANLEKVIQKRTLELEHLNHELEEKIKLAEYGARHDPLTGLYNRRCFEEKLEAEINRAKRYSQPMSVVLLDIDDFKLINDDFGHSAGDQILKALALFLNEHTREYDLIARWGGEEFIIIMPNTNLQQAFDKAERLRLGIENQTLMDQAKITCSFGVTEYKSTDTYDQIFQRTDKALYQAKHLNRNNVQIA
ncbi:diguanylate cyclase [Thiomicrorhabdus sp. zzn3]|uniref:sensor domain-containing diguanylate cyclase n=1 Tax=Thiomicrorhabdus sp. zzn3 TaxID=3039775 RepID=UPI002436BDB2|nr:diguanylate cyclase [Thiomicrorhabdus sp. zzn3]MDG6777906.1 diguanylate cyclase [Thiomicrorhabdus sp. zzn3]